MRQLRYTILPLFLILATFSAGQADAREPLKTTIYQVQALGSHYFTGYFWHTVFETTDRDDAELMEALLWVAFDNGELDDLVSHERTTSFYDFRIKTVVEYHDVRKTRQLQSISPTTFP